MRTHARGCRGRCSSRARSVNISFLKDGFPVRENGSLPQRLGRNSGRYAGESLDAVAVLSSICNAADRTGWHRDFSTVAGGADLLAYRRRAVAAKKTLYLSAGIHGDEPAGPLAIATLLAENVWPDTVDIWLCPCLNPSGLQLNTRENALGVDLNRDYRHLLAPEVEAHIGWLRNQPDFDVTICLHEDWEANGFYLYEVNPDRRPSFAKQIVQSVDPLCPIETAATVDGWELKEGIIRPDIDPLQREQWPEALFLIMNKTRLAYTLEAASDFAMQTRVQVLVSGVRTVLHELAR